MNRQTILKICVGALLACSSLALQNRALADDYEQRNLAQLYKRYAKRVASPVPWAGFWWPYNENGTVEAMQGLDLALGNGAGATEWEYANHGQALSVPEWYGHCNGWATAAIMEREPRNARSINGINFSIGDRKALLSEYWMESGSDMIGTRINDPGDTYSDAFWDVTPAQFHLLLTNVVGREGRSLIVDRHTGAEVWNQPVVGYEIEPITKDDYLGPDPQYSNVYRINVTTTLWWTNDEVKVNAITSEFKWKEDRYFESRELRYELWLDAPPRFDASGKLVSSGDIIITSDGVGGAWKNGSSYEELVNSHPDFMWIPLSYASSSGYKNPQMDDEWVYDNIRSK